MYTNLYFCRHAHSVYTPEESSRPLSEHGFEAAKRVASCMRNEQIHHVVSSPYMRAVQTVEGIARQFGLEIERIEDFKERKLAEGTANDFETAIKRVWEDPHFSWEGGESNVAAQRRGVAATRLLLEKYRGNNVAVGTHGNIMVLIMNHFDPRYDFEFWTKLTMPDIYKLSFRSEALIDCRRVWTEEGSADR